MHTTSFRPALAVALLSLPALVAAAETDPHVSTAQTHLKQAFAAGQTRGAANLKTARGHLAAARSALNAGGLPESVADVVEGLVLLKQFQHAAAMEALKAARDHKAAPHPDAQRIRTRLLIAQKKVGPALAETEDLALRLLAPTVTVSDTAKQRYFAWAGRLVGFLTTSPKYKSSAALAARVGETIEAKLAARPELLGAYESGKENLTDSLDDVIAALPQPGQANAALAENSGLPADLFAGAVPLGGAAPDAPAPDAAAPAAPMPEAEPNAEPDVIAESKADTQKRLEEEVFAKQDEAQAKRDELQKNQSEMEAKVTADLQAIDASLSQLYAQYKQLEAQATPVQAEITRLETAMSFYNSSADAPKLGAGRGSGFGDRTKLLGINRDLSNARLRYQQLSNAAADVKTRAQVLMTRRQALVAQAQRFSLNVAQENQELAAFESALENREKRIKKQGAQRERNLKRNSGQALKFSACFPLDPAVEAQSVIRTVADLPTEKP